MSLPSPLYAFVTEESIRPTRNGDRYFYQFTLRTVALSIKANMWNAHPGSSEKDVAFPHKGDIIMIDDLKDELESHKSIIIYHFKRISKEELPETERFICEHPQADAKKIAAAWSVITDKTLYKEESHRSFVSKCFSKLDKKKLEICPAACRIHHCMGGGLLLHTAEVIKIAKAIYDSCHEDYPFVNSDVLMAASTLHDLGKIFTYFIDDVGLPEHLITEKMIGHMYFGIELVRNVGKETNTDWQFVDEVSHAIASHHGKVEFGNIKPIQSQEALILHAADLISSRNGMIENKLQEVIRASTTLPENFSIYSDPYFASSGMLKYIADNNNLI